MALTGPAEHQRWAAGLWQGMKAITYSSAGDSSVLQLVDRPAADPGRTRCAFAWSCPA
jgi:hypothetical protein